MTHLSVNVNKIATLRNTRSLGIPSVVRLSRIALDAGADGITVHPRPDQRHIRPDDVDDIGQLMRSYPRAEFNIEGNPFHGLIEHCRRVRPHQATLVPDAREALTSNHGWNLAELDVSGRSALEKAIAELKRIGCRVSLFMDPVPSMIPLARQLGADRIELYTEPYAIAFACGRLEQGIGPYIESARIARQSGLGVNAGHDLNLENLPPFLQKVPGVDEVSIGHALIADALEFGLAETVRRYQTICQASK
ncbi:MAG: pyridoxine 5'-phosphate synthase [Phycisphaerae bacterium]|jgi:pyridoxine 5-phosphate synthase|nr:MAG: pyridoxine 5'-phosphate synthase [Phycisphaerae bacterium]